MDDLKLFARSEKETESVVQTVRIVSEDIGMKFGLDMCAVLIMKRGYWPTEWFVAGGIGDRSYKYLGTLESEGVLYQEYKERLRDEYTRRVMKCLKS